MALDYGERRIGVAVTDPTGVLAQPLETIERKSAQDTTPLRRIAELVSEYEVDQIVVGLPLHMDGSSGPEAEAARGFGAAVLKRTGASVEFMDERWTTREAERAMSEAGASARQRRGRVDPVAASLLLRAYLETKSG